MTRKILLVDDDEMVLIAVADLLRSHGYQVKTASSGDTALDLADHEPFDLCILDAVMPGITGTDLADRLRSLDQHKKMPIIMLSQADTAADMDPRFASEIKLTIIKPIRPERLVAMVESVLL